MNLEDKIMPFEITVSSQLYGVTTCVVFYEPFMKGRRTFCCGDGSDYTLDKHEVDKAQQWFNIQVKGLNNNAKE